MEKIETLVLDRGDMYEQYRKLPISQITMYHFTDSLKYMQKEAMVVFIDTNGDTRIFKNRLGEVTDEYGRRFKTICHKLDELGVFYGKNYSGKYHEEFPHSGYWFALHLDKHRGGFESIIYHDGDPHINVSVYDGSSQSPSEMIVELLEKSYDIIINKLTEKKTDG